MTDDLFDRARDQVSCVDIAVRKGVKLRRAGKQHRGPCPLRGCGEKSKLDPFVVRPAKSGRGDTWRCYSCEPGGGDVVDLEHRLFGVGGETLADAARRLTGGEVRRESDEERERRAQRRARQEREATESEAWKAELAKGLWREAASAVGTLAQTYLEARGPRGPVVARAVEILRFHPRAWHSGHPEFGTFLPAMIGLVMTELGPTGGVHVTYLKPDGSAKTHRKPAKRMLGPQGHRAWMREIEGRPLYRPMESPPAEGEIEVLLPGGIWLTRPDGAGPLVVAEGIENSLSRAEIKAGDLHRAVRAVAAGSLDRLQGFEVVDDDKCRDVWTPTGDPTRPPFTWPEDPAHPWGEVDVATDGDMSPIKVLGRAGRKRRPALFTRDAAGRAWVSGTLAVNGWKRRLAADSQTRVGWSRPPLGRDFNDELRSIRAAAETTSEAA